MRGFLTIGISSAFVSLTALLLAGPAYHTDLIELRAAFTLLRGAA